MSFVRELDNEIYFDKVEFETLANKEHFPMTEIDKSGKSLTRPLFPCYPKL